MQTFAAVAKFINNVKTLRRSNRGRPSPAHEPVGSCSNTNVPIVVLDNRHRSSTSISSTSISSIESSAPSASSATSAKTVHFSNTTEVFFTYSAREYDRGMPEPDSENEVWDYEELGWI